MIKIRLFALLFCVFAFPSLVIAANGALAEISVFQTDPESSENILLVSDTVELVEGVALSSFLMGLSTDVDLIAADSQGVMMNIHVITLGPPSNTYSRSFQVEYGLPARLTDIEGKGGARYIFQTKPLGQVDVDTVSCNFNHRRAGDFKFDPSAHMDIYYVPSSFGDFYWSSVKGTLEEGYRLFKARFNLNLPGKYLIYLSPCELNSVMWDTRFGMSVNPSKSTAFAVFAKTFSAVDPFLVNHAASLRTFGYAPPILAEGLAGYFSLPAFDIKKITAEHAEPILPSLLNTHEFISADPHFADRVASSFVHFLIDHYGDDKFFATYKKSDDLNLKNSIEEVYGMSIESIEAEWRNYVDTVSLSLDYMTALTDKAEAGLNYPLMASYAEGMLGMATSATDSLRSLSRVERSAFLVGNYYDAAGAKEAALRIENDARGLMSLGTYQMMNGLYDEAKENLDRAAALNPSSQLIKFNLGLWHHVTGDNKQARKYWTDIIVNPIDGSAQAESRILLGHLLLKSRDEGDRAQAITYFTEGVGMFEQTLRQHSASPSTEMWTGIGYAGLGDTENAYNRLSTALFLETRPFHLGFIHLWLGKVADLLGEREVAREYYGQVLAAPSAVYHQTEAKRYLEEAYTQ